MTHKCYVYGLILCCLIIGLLSTLEAIARDSEDSRPRTWRTVAEMSIEEKAQMDLRTDTPRDAKVAYLPAERFPFKAPYTAEEMGIRSMEYPHSPYWNSTLIDIASTVTGSGFMDQRVSIIPILYLPEGGFEEQLYNTVPGEEIFRWLSQAVSPAERYGTQTLFIGYRTDQTFSTKVELFAYSPALRRIRRQPAPRREDRLPNGAATFDDLIGRDAWEFDWRILGVDTLYETVRFPITRQTAVLTDIKGNYIDVHAKDVKLMGPDYPLYTGGGGVKCFVVESTPKGAWHKDYYVSKLIYWLDQQSFFPLRIEEYDKDGNLIFVNARTGVRANQALGDRGYAVLFDLWWDISIDLMQASIHGILSREWSEEDRRVFFSSGFMRREWFLEPPKGMMALNSPEEFYLRPPLERDKFPQERKIELDAQLENRIAAQEREGRMVFEMGVVARN